MTKEVNREDADSYCFAVCLLHCRNNVVETEGTIFTNHVVQHISCKRRARSNLGGLTFAIFGHFRDYSLQENIMNTEKINHYES